MNIWVKLKIDILTGAKDGIKRKMNPDKTVKNKEFTATNVKITLIPLKYGTIANLAILVNALIATKMREWRIWTKMKY